MDDQQRAIALKLQLSVNESELCDIVDWLKSHKEIRKKLDKEDIRQLQIVKLLPYIKDEWEGLYEVYKNLRRHGYKRRFDIFKKEIIQISCYDLVEIEREKEVLRIKNSSDNSIFIEIN